MVYNNNIII